MIEPVRQMVRLSAAVKRWLAVTLLVAGCGASALAPSPSPADPSSTQPAATPKPVESANPCRVPVAHVQAFAGQLGTGLASLRPMITTQPFESSATANAILAVSGTLTAFDGLERRLLACSRTADLADRMAELRDRARALISQSVETSVDDAEAQRPAAVGLFELLPVVQGLATESQAIADELGIAGQVALVPPASAEPIGSLLPLPTPTPRPTPTPESASTSPPAAGVPAFADAYFGSHARVVTYRVTGGSPSAIVTSIRASGPVSRWLGGRAEALTRADPHYRFEFSQLADQCRIVPTAKPAVFFSFTITLPKWVPPSGASRATVRWWSDRLRDTAAHERHHVDLTRAAGVRMTDAVATSTCGSLAGNLRKIASDLNRQNCEFDMKEYGAALGLTLSECLTQ